MRCLQFSLALVGAMLFATVANAASIGVSYAGDNGGGTSIQITAAQTAGVVPQINWNAATGAGGSLAAGTVVDDSAVVQAGTVVTWASNNTWGGTGATTDDEAMVNGWLDDGGQSTSVTGIPYAFYDVYVYGSSDAGNGGQLLEWTINGTLYTSGGAFTDPVSANGTYFDGTTYVDAATAAANPTYRTVSGLSGDLSISGVRVAGVRGGVSGFQIVEGIPEPGSIVLLGLGAIGLGIVARRRG